MYVLLEFHPYEGHDVTEFETEEEAKTHLTKAKTYWGFQSQYFTLYEVVKEIDVNKFIEEN